MKISFDNVRAHVSDVSSAEEAWLFDFLAFTDGQALRRGKRGSRFRLYNMGDKTFPTGSIGSVVREWNRLGELPVHDESMSPRAEVRPAWRDHAELHLEDIREKPVEPEPNADLAWLHWYQREACEVFTKFGRGIIKVPTGGGKTEIVVGLTRIIPCRWLFIVHRSGLMWDARERWLKREEQRTFDLANNLERLASAGHDVTEADWEEVMADPRVGVFGDGTNDVLDTDPFIVATFQTLYERYDHGGKEVLRMAEAIVIDECHVQPADTFMAVTNEAINAYYRCGLSGTPLERGDKRNVMAIGALGRVVYSIPPKVLIEAGHMARPIIRMVQCDQSEEVVQSEHCLTCNGSGIVYDQLLKENVVCEPCRGMGKKKPHYSKIYKSGVAKSVRRNRTLISIAKACAKPSMLFVESVAQGRALRKAFEKAGVTVRFVYSQQSTAQRKQAEKDLARGHLDMIITTRVFQEGIDVPNLASVVQAAAGRSPIASLQRLGRGSRVTETKRTFEMWDVFDQGHEMLRRHANERKRAYEKEGYEVEVLSSGEAFGLES